MDYSLSALRKVREHKKNLAECTLKNALSDHEQAQIKLENIRQSLKQATCHRAKNEDDFFSKSQISPFNKREIICHASYGKKNIITEGDLKKYIKQQEEEVSLTELKLNIAKTSLCDADRQLKIIDKHFDCWQRQKKIITQNKLDEQADDINQTRFILRTIKP